MTHSCSLQAKRNYRAVFPKATAALLLLLVQLAGEHSARCDVMVCGNIVNETWTKANSRYRVTCDILVAKLTIEPGVTVLFEGNYLFEVPGMMIALGTEDMPILFTRTNSTTGWQGILFNQIPPGSEMAYCIVERSASGGIRTQMITVELLIRNCVIRNNTSASHGGGLRLDIASGGVVKLMDCDLINNRANPAQANANFVGGAAFRYGSGTLICDGCRVIGNRVDSHCTAQGCDALARGGGFFLRDGPTVVRNCVFESNRVHSDEDAPPGLPSDSVTSLGGAIYLDSGTLSMTNTIVATNFTTASWQDAGVTLQGGGIYINAGTANLVNSTIVYNDNEGLRRGGGTLRVISSIIFFNTGAEISGTATVTYSCVEGTPVYPGEGNINFHPALCPNLIILPGSPCIDAGNPDPIHNDLCFRDLNDPNFPCVHGSLGTVRNDMGADGGLGTCCWNESCDGPVCGPIPNQQSCTGQTVTFCANAIGAEPLSYQWRFHGTFGPTRDLPGETGPCLTLSNLEANDAGFYSVRVSNAFGSCDSAPTRLLVFQACVSLALYPGLRITGMVGRTYCVRYTTDLSDNPVWTSLTNITLATPEFFYLDPQPARWCDNSLVAPPRRFYRVDEGPCP